MYNTHCVICGRPITVRAKTHKYCTSCRASINYQKQRLGTHKKAVEYLKNKKIQLREKNLSRKTISDVVEISLKTGKSYGYTVASLEGRL